MKKGKTMSLLSLVFNVVGILLLAAVLPLAFFGENWAVLLLYCLVFSTLSSLLHILGIVLGFLPFLKGKREVLDKAAFILSLIAIPLLILDLSCFFFFVVSLGASL